MKTKSRRQKKYKSRLTKQKGGLMPSTLSPSASPTVYAKNVLNRLRTSKQQIKAETILRIATPRYKL